MTKAKNVPARDAGDAARVIAEVNDLTWTGQPEAAIARATAALAAGGLAPEQEAELLDLRAENHHWRGETERCAADAQALAALGRRARRPAITALALRRDALIAFRRGDIESTLRAADAALAAARKGGDEVIEAHCLATLGFLRAMARSDPEGAPDLVRGAVAIFERRGLAVFLGRALMMLGNTYVGLERPQETTEHCTRALATARQCGDLACQAAALNLIAWFEVDQAKVMKMRQQALAAYTAAGHLHGRAIIIGNLGSHWVEMGLYRRARRLLLEADAMHRRMGNMGALAVNSGNLFEVELRTGHLDAACAAGAEAAHW